MQFYDHNSLKNSLDPDEDENKTRMDLIDLCIQLAAKPKEEGGSGYVVSARSADNLPKKSITCRYAVIRIVNRQSSTASSVNQMRPLPTTSHLNVLTITRR